MNSNPKGIYVAKSNTFYYLYCTCQEPRNYIQTIIDKLQLRGLIKIEPDAYSFMYLKDVEKQDIVIEPLFLTRNDRKNFEKENAKNETLTW